MARPVRQHYVHSSFREKLIEHLLIGEWLKVSWQSGQCSLEIAKPEVDNRGYDLIAEVDGVVRHIQLKAARIGATASSQKVHIALAEKPSGCILWVYFDEDLTLGPFLLFAGPPGEPLPSLDAFRVARHTKGNAQGIKAKRPDIRVVPKGQFERLETAAEVFDALFGRREEEDGTVAPEASGDA